jgi:ankyrin repeat protein
MVRLLLDHGADPSLKTVSRMSEPKQFAEWTAEVTSLVWPLREFKRVLFQPYEGETPLDMALREGNAEIVNTLKR